MLRCHVSSTKPWLAGHACSLVHCHPGATGRPHIGQWARGTLLHGRCAAAVCQLAAWATSASLAGHGYVSPPHLAILMPCPAHAQCCTGQALEEGDRVRGPHGIQQERRGTRPYANGDGSTDGPRVSPRVSRGQKHDEATTAHADSAIGYCDQQRGLVGRPCNGAPCLQQQQGQPAFGVNAPSLVRNVRCRSCNHLLPRKTVCACQSHNRTQASLHKLYLVLQWHCVLFR